MLKAVIFDMDGVIIDSEPAHLKLENQMYKELGIEVTKEEHDSFVGTTSHYMWETLKTKHKLPQSLEELVKNDRERYYNHLISEECEIVLVDGVRELIKELHDNGMRLAIASSSPLDVIEAVVRIFNLEQFFEVLVTGDFVKRSKPNPDIFLHAAEKLGVNSSECIVIEDSHNGVKAAKAAGMKCIGIKNPSSGDQDIGIADIIINSFSEINCKKVKAIIEG